MENLSAIAMFIDSDNTQIKKLEAVIREVSAFGRIVVKRAYGNWTKSFLKNWDEEIKRLAIKPIQQTDYVKGKNTTDMALTIDAMDLLHTEKYDGFAIVSSDSEFTPLAIKLRESGKYVIGIGESKTSEAFISSCDTFIYLEPLKDIEDLPVPADDKPETRTRLSLRKKDLKFELETLLRIAYDRYQDDEGFVNVSSAGTYIKRVKPDFDIRAFGFRKLPEYLEANPQKYEIKKYAGKGHVTIIAYKIID